MLPNNAATVQAHKKEGEAAIEARFQLQTFVTKAPVADPSFDAPRKSGVKS